MPPAAPCRANCRRASESRREERGPAPRPATQMAPPRHQARIAQLSFHACSSDPPDRKGIYTLNGGLDLRSALQARPAGVDFALQRFDLVFLEVPVAALREEVVAHGTGLLRGVEGVAVAVLDFVEREHAALHGETRHGDALVFGHAPAV